VRAAPSHWDSTSVFKSWLIHNKIKQEANPVNNGPALTSLHSVRLLFFVDI
jgi:hypothetical protein